jgi:hypothetical protein
MVSWTEKDWRSRKRKQKLIGFFQVTFLVKQSLGDEMIGK